MTDFHIGQIIGPNDTTKVNALPVGAIVVDTKDNTVRTKPEPGTSLFWVEGGSGYSTFRVAYLPTPKPEPKELLPLKVETSLNRQIQVEKSGVGAWIQVKETGLYTDHRSVAAVLSKENARQIAVGLLAAIGEPLAFQVGDKVRVEDKGGYRHGEFGTITEPLDSDSEYFVKFGDYDSSYIHMNNLLLAA